MRDEAKSVLERYKRRSRIYDPLDPAVYSSRQEFERKLIAWLRNLNNRKTSDLSLLEVGCGAGGNLQQFLRLGFQAENMVGNELQKSRARHARARLPSSIEIIEGDALDLQFEECSFDIVFQSLVFSSILDYETRNRLAQKMWKLAKPGGGVLWYDFIYNNPTNPDVKGITRAEVLRLFPDAKMNATRLTLAPPISRLVTRIYPGLYSVFNAIPLLRTHILCWLEKRDDWRRT